MGVKCTGNQLPKKANGETPKILNPKQAAAYLGVCLPTIYALLNSQQSGFPGVRVTPRKWIILQDDLVAWLHQGGMHNGQGGI